MLNFKDKFFHICLNNYNDIDWAFRALHAFLNNAQKSSIGRARGPLGMFSFLPMKSIFRDF